MAAQAVLSRISQDDINWAIETSRDRGYRDYITGIEEATERGLQRGLQQGRMESQAIIEQLQAEIARLKQMVLS